jgi:hypothetical protein
MKKRFASLFVAATITAIGFASGASGHGAVATASKACSRAARERGDVTAQTPGGVRCLGPGEYCSHKRGYAKAYLRAGFRCNAKWRLERI